MAAMISRARAVDVMIAVALFALGLALNLHYGRRGFMPLDQGIVFDGAWRLMLGQVPFRDFNAPNALVPALMQVPFFRVFGVTWLAFCLHASVMNGLFSVLAYVLLRLTGATRLEGAFFAGLTAFYFYPPNGTPFMDQHAFFFLTLMFTTVAAGTFATTPRTEWRWWALVPLCFTLAYLSKQIPTAFGAVCVAAWVVANPRRAPRWMGALAAGTAAVVVAVVLLQWRLHFSYDTAFTYLVKMPLDVGAERTPSTGVVGPFRLVVGTTRRLPGGARQWSMYVPLLGIVALLLARKAIERWRTYAWLLASLFVTTGAFLAYTLNQIEDGFCLLMVSACLGAVALRLACTHLLPAGLGRRAGLAAAALVALAASRDTAVFARDVDATRYVLDTKYNAEVAALATPFLPPALQFLEWTRINCSPQEFGALVTYLKESEGDFAVISDHTLLYGLTGKVPVSPALWLHPGLSIPRPGTTAFSAFEAELIRRLDTFNVHRLVLDRPWTLRNVHLGLFPRLQELVASERCGERQFGNVHVVELCPPAIRPR